MCWDTEQVETMWRCGKIWIFKQVVFTMKVKMSTIVINVVCFIYILTANLEPVNWILEYEFYYLLSMSREFSVQSKALI